MKKKKCRILSLTMATAMTVSALSAGQFPVVVRAEAETEQKPEGGNETENQKPDAENPQFEIGIQTASGRTEAYA